MVPIVPHESTSAGLTQPEMLARSTPINRPYFETSGTVKIGPYRGRLRYLVDPHDNGACANPNGILPSLFASIPIGGDDHVPCRGVRAVAIIETKRGVFRKLLDLFRGIGFDGTVSVSRRELIAFVDMEKSIAAWRTAEIPADSMHCAVQRGSRVAHLQHGIASQAKSEQAIGELRSLLKTPGHDDHATWHAIGPLLRLPAVAQAVWTSDKLLGSMLDRCPDHTALFRLAATYSRAGGSTAGLLALLNNDGLARRHLLPLLKRCIEGRNLTTAVEILAHFDRLLRANGRQLFSDGPGAPPCSSASKLWRELLRKASTFDHLVKLAVFHPTLDYPCYIEGTLKNLGPDGVAKPRAIARQLLAEALQTAQSMGTVDVHKCSEHIEMRRLVEVSLPRFLAGPEAKNGPMPDVPANSERARAVFGDEEIVVLLRQARQRFGKVVDFDRLAACTNTLRNPAHA